MLMAAETPDYCCVIFFTFHRHAISIFYYKRTMALQMYHSPLSVSMFISILFDLFLSSSAYFVLYLSACHLILSKFHLHNLTLLARPPSPLCQAHDKIFIETCFTIFSSIALSSVLSMYRLLIDILPQIYVLVQDCLHIKCSEPFHPFIK